MANTTKFGFGPKANVPTALEENNRSQIPAVPIPGLQRDQESEPQSIEKVPYQESMFPERYVLPGSDTGSSRPPCS